MNSFNRALRRARDGDRLSDAEVFALADDGDHLAALMNVAAA
jgi:hypothetical protein